MGKPLQLYTQVNLINKSTTVGAGLVPASEINAIHLPETGLFAEEKIPNANNQIRDG